MASTVSHHSLCILATPILVWAFASEAFAGDRMPRSQHYQDELVNGVKGSTSKSPSSQGADWLNPLFGNQRRYRDVTGTGIQNLNKLKKSRREIMNDLGTQQPTQPSAAKGRVRSRH